MNREHDISAIARAIRTAKLRAAFARVARRSGQFRGHIIRRITYFAGRRAYPSKPQIRLSVLVLITMPSVPSIISCVGLGLAGGGGGSPGKAIY